MTAIDRRRRQARGPRQTAIAAATGFFLAAFVLLLSLLVFQKGHRIVWPPSASFPHSLALVVEGILCGIAAAVAIYLFARLVAAWKDAAGWREFKRLATTVVTVAAIVALSVSMSVNVFYWPWARANAIRTILANSEKWRLIAAAAAIRDRWDRRVAQDLRAGFGDSSPAVQVCAAYALATHGDNAYLKRLLDLAQSLPPDRPDGAPPSLANDLSSQADALLLLKRLTAIDAGSLDGYRAAITGNYANLTWDGHGKYRLNP